MKKITVFFSLFLIVIICTLCLYAEFSFRDISAGVVRLHILANSNTEEDQKLKLKVRDCILEQARTLLANAGNKGDSMAILGENTAVFEKKARECISREGYDYDVQVSLDKCDFPTKSYKNLTLPQGEYDALRVVIGSGLGDNWWCVVFPPFCLGDAATSSDKPKDVTIKFKLVEIYNGLKKKLKSIW